MYVASCFRGQCHIGDDCDNCYGVVAVCALWFPVVQCSTMEGVIPTSQQSSHLTECTPAGDVLSLNQDTLRNHPIVNYGTTVCYRCRDAEQGAPPYAKTVGNVMRQCDGSGNFSGAVLECDGKLFCTGHIDHFC